MNVLVTGGAGFIGKHTCEALRQHGHEAVVFDRRADRADFLGDLNNPVDVTEAVAHAEAVIHLAAGLGTQETIANPLPAAQTNVLGSLNVWQACAQYRVPAVYIGVGNWFMDNSYSITKTCAERFVRMFNQERGTRITVVRAVNAYGPGQSAAAPFGYSKVRKITPAFVCRALTGMPVEVYGDGEQVSDMVFVADVAEVLVRVLEQAAEGNVFSRAVEVGPSEHNTVNEVAGEVIVAAGTGVPLKHLPMRPGEDPSRPVTADTETLALVGMTADELTPLEIGIGVTVDWFRETEGVSWHRSATEVAA